MQAAGGASVGDADAPQTASTPGNRKVSLAAFAGVAAVLLATDVVTKIVAVAELDGRGRVPLVGDVLGLTLVRNPGAAFNAGTNYTVVISVIATGAALAVLWYARRLGSLVWAVALGCLLAGICGNLSDRLFRAPGPFRGEVVDFLQLPNWPVFNVADICINLGAGLILLQAFRGVALTGARHPGRDAGTGSA